MKARAPQQNGVTERKKITKQNESFVMMNACV